MRVVWTAATRLVPGDNAREHWAAKANRLSAQKRIAWAATYQQIKTGEKWRTATVTITRIGKRKMDSDNLASSAKAVRDGVASALGVDDGSERYEWRYAQAIGKEYGVRVEIELK